MSYRGRKQGSYGSQIRRAKRVQARRSAHAKAVDAGLTAPKAKSVEQWLSAPNRYDIPDIDTPKKSSRVSEAYFWKNAKNFDRLINKDDIEEKNSANKNVVEQILKTLNENNIPYYYGGEEAGIQILTKDLERAEKLTDRLYIALKKTL
jgi:hypothetical protein